MPLLVLLSALQNLPDELYEAARIDGAGRLAQFRYVTLPGISATLALLAVLAFIYSTQQFTLIWLITGGGPVDATPVGGGHGHGHSLSSGGRR